MTPDIESAVIGALTGAAATLVVDRVAVRRWRLAAAARSLAEAFWEELSATAFTNWPAGGTDYWEYAGFSSQTFDTQFALMSEALPRTLQILLMRYHWRMKALEDFKVRMSGHYPPADLTSAARTQREELLARLRAYADRDLADLFVNREEELP